MKKVLSLMLVVVLLMCSTTALAAGKLQVVQENCHFVKSYWNYLYTFAKVENVGDKPIKVNAGVLEIYENDLGRTGKTGILYNIHHPIDPEHFSGTAHDHLATLEKIRDYAEY